jgi:hypothetical protein
VPLKEGLRGERRPKERVTFMDDSNETNLYIFSSFVISLNFSIDRQFFKNLTFSKNNLLIAEREKVLGWY